MSLGRLAPDGTGSALVLAGDVGTGVVADGDAVAVAGIVVGDVAVVADAPVALDTHSHRVAEKMAASKMLAEQPESVGVHAVDTPGNLLAGRPADTCWSLLADSARWHASEGTAAVAPAAEHVLAGMPARALGVLLWPAPVPAEQGCLEKLAAAGLPSETTVSPGMRL